MDFATIVSGQERKLRLGGQTCFGEADILGVGYRTAYLPIYRKDGEISGALYVGGTSARRGIEIAIRFTR